MFQGDISPVTEIETIWEICVVLLGACFTAGLVGAFGALLSQNDTLGLNSFKIKMKKLKQYMIYRCIPDHLQSSIFFFHHCRWQDSQALDERETLSILPEPLQLDISFAVKKQVIYLVPVLKSLPMIVQKRIAHALILQVYPPHSTIYDVGDIGWEVYFIMSGVVSIALPTDLSELDATGRSNATANKQKFESIGLIIGVGNHLGESCLSSESGVRQETVTTKTTVELYTLSKSDFNNICRFMSSDKARDLKQSLVTRNGNVWHNFDDDGCNLEESPREAMDASIETLRGRSDSIFTWSSRKNLCRISFDSHKPGTKERLRRRKLSQPHLQSYSFSARKSAPDIFQRQPTKCSETERFEKGKQQPIHHILFDRSKTWDPGSSKSY